MYKTQFLSKETIVKERFAKKYRHPVLDEKITKTRLGQVCGRTITKIIGSKECSKMQTMGNRYTSNLPRRHRKK